MKLIEYTAHNVKACKDIRFNLEGYNLFIVGGRNDNGKTSSIEALLMALCRKSGMDYPKPALREGEKEGWVRVQLSGDKELHDEEGFVVELELKRRRDKTVKEGFRVLDSTGESAPEPTKLLRRLFHNKGFDPLAFDRLEKRERREKLMKMVGLDLSEFKEKHEKIYNKRTEVNRDVDKAKARFEAMKEYDDAPKKPVKVDDLMEDLKKAQEHNAEIKEAVVLLGKAEDGKQKTEQIIATLKEELAKAEEALKIDTENVTLAKKALDGLGDAKDTDTISTEIKEAGVKNEKLQANARKQDARKEWKDLEDQSESLTEEIEELEKEQDEKLEAAEWPVPGMSVDDEGVLLDGLPFESACKSKRVVASVRMGMSLNPKLRLLVCEDGSDLDADTMKELDKVLKENDFQMIVEVVTRNPQDEEMCAVVIVDGKVKEREEDQEVATAS